MNRKKSITCNDVLDSFRYAVRQYDVEKVYQTDLKPISVLALDNLFPKVYRKKFKDAFLQVNNVEEDRHRKKVIKNLKNFEYIKGECVVDLNIMRGNKDPFKTLITAESEAWSTAARFLNKSSGIDNNDMLWDLYKLIHYPSPLRLFITLSSLYYHSKLLSATSRIIKVYSKQIKPGDIFSIQIPTANLKRDNCTIAYWSENHLRKKPVSIRAKLI